MAQARARPSKVEVPLPTSSRMSSERGVAWCRIRAHSAISTMKVLWPRARSSAAPTRVKSRSTTPMRARVAGTNDPVCANTAISATWRMAVLFPAMFGPVSTISRFSASSSTSLGTKGPSPDSESARSTTGCRPPWISITSLSSTSGRTQPDSEATRAKESSASACAAASAQARSPALRASTAWRSSSKICCSRAARRSSAERTRASCSVKAGVTKRSAPTVLDLRW